MTRDSRAPGGAMEGEPHGSLHPDYFRTRFRVLDSLPDWPDEFVIISARATTGERWAEEENEEADEGLYRELERLNVWMEAVTGYAADTGHSEDSWAAELSLDVACNLGQRFKQDAVFHVRGDLLSVTHCDRRRQLVPVGSFRERIDVVDYHTMYPRFSVTSGSPWRLLTAEGLSAAIDRCLRLASASSSSRVQVFVAERDLRLEQALVDAMPDTVSRAQAQEDVDADSVSIEEVAHLLPAVRDRGWVIQCEVTDSMVSGRWGLTEFSIGNRGYLYHTPEAGIGEAPSIVAAWAPVDDPEARRDCIVSTYVRLWDEIGLPPFLGQWIRGEPQTLHAALLATLDDSRGKGGWGDVIAQIMCAGVTEVAPASWSEIARVYNIPEAWIERTARVLADPISGLSERAVQGHVDEDEQEALGALYLASITPEYRSLLEQPARQWLGPVTQLLGIWDIGYVKHDGMIDDDRSATLILRPDGSFSWDPPPEWLPGSGSWGLELQEDGAPKLRFRCGYREWSHFVVLQTVDGHGTMFHWQRTHHRMIVFKDRILMGYLVGTEE